MSSEYVHPREGTGNGGNACRPVVARSRTGQDSRLRPRLSSGPNPSHVSSSHLLSWLMITSYPSYAGPNNVEPHLPAPSRSALEEFGDCKVAGGDLLGLGILSHLFEILLDQLPNSSRPCNKSPSFQWPLVKTVHLSLRQALPRKHQPRSASSSPHPRGRWKPTRRGFRSPRGAKVFGGQVVEAKTGGKLRLLQVWNIQHSCKL